MDIPKYKLEIINKIKSAKNLNIMKIIHGKSAFNIMRYISFDLKNKKPDNFDELWNDYEKNTSILIIYEHKPKVHAYIVFNLIIGSKNSKHFSLIGEKYDYKSGTDIIKKLNI